MKNIIMVPGEVTGPFFEKEIDYAAKYFNIIAILSYNDDKERALKVLEKHGISADKLVIIPKMGQCIRRGKINPFKLLKWLFRKEVRREIFEKCIHGPKRIRRFESLIVYGTMSVLLEPIINKMDQSLDNLVVYSFWMCERAYALAVLKDKGYFPNAKLVCRAHGYDLYEKRNSAGYIPFRSYINEKYDCISFIAKQGQDYFLQSYPYPDNKQVSYLGTENPYGLKKYLNEKNEICIASCSNVIPLKRLDLIINCLQALDGYKIHWIHLGTGVQFNEIRSLAQEKLQGTTISWDFLGRISNEHVLKMYMDSDVDFFINLSDTEGLPVSIMEALSIGIPVIARNVGGMAEIIKGSSGLLLPQQWSEENYKLIQTFVSSRLNNVQYYRSLSDNAFSVWTENFDAQKNYEEFFSGLQSL